MENIRSAAPFGLTDYCCVLPGVAQLLLAQRWVQGAKHTILLQKPKPRLHHSRDEGQQNGYIEMTLSSSESGY